MDEEIDLYLDTNAVMNCVAEEYRIETFSQDVHLTPTQPYVPVASIHPQTRTTTSSFRRGEKGILPSPLEEEVGADYSDQESERTGVVSLGVDDGKAFSGLKKEKSAHEEFLLRREGFELG